MAEVSDPEPILAKAMQKKRMEYGVHNYSVGFDPTSDGILLLQCSGIIS